MNAADAQTFGLTGNRMKAIMADIKTITKGKAKMIEWKDVEVKRKPELEQISADGKWIKKERDGIKIFRSQEISNLSTVGIGGGKTDLQSIKDCLIGIERAIPVYLRTTEDLKTIIAEYEK